MGKTLPTCRIRYSGTQNWQEGLGTNANYRVAQRHDREINVINAEFFVNILDYLWETKYWKGVRKDNPEVAQELMDKIWQSRAKNTIKAYIGAIEKWRKWAEKHNKRVLPARESDVAAFLIEQGRKDRTPAPTNQRTAALRWLHKNAQLPDPTDGCATRALLEATARKLQAGRKRKKEMSPNLLQRLRDRAEDGSGEGKQMAAYMGVSFGAFLRFAEARELQWGDIEETDKGMIISIRGAKNDQTREGRKTYIEATGNKACPVEALHRWKKEQRPDTTVHQFSERREENQVIHQSAKN